MKQTDLITNDSISKGAITMKKTTVKTKITAMALAVISVFTAAIMLFGAGGKAFAATVNDDVATTTMLGESPAWVTQLPAAKDASQLFVVAAYDKSTAWVSMHEKDADGKWQMIMTTPGYIGKNGLGKTKEGDGKTPVGTFGFNAAFGIADDPGCAIPYLKVNDHNYWSGDTREGMQYNKMVNIQDYPTLDKDASEHIVDYTRQYQYCLNISYNEACDTNAGSAIFLHCLGPCKPYTGGCVAIPENQMKLVMQHVKPDCKVVIDSLENLGGSF